MKQFITIPAMLLMMACAKQEETIYPVTFKVGISEETKTYVFHIKDKFKCFWHQNDAISVLVCGDKNASGVFHNSNEDGTYAEFNGIMNLPISKMRIYTFYPSSAVGKYTEKTISVTLPSEQVSTANLTYLTAGLDHTQIDPTADLLWGEPQDFVPSFGTSGGIVVDVRTFYRRICSFVKVNPQGLGDHSVDRVMLSYGGKDYGFSGIREASTQSGEWGDWISKKTNVAVSYVKNRSIPVMVSVYPGTLEQGNTLQVTFYGGTDYITKKVNLKQSFKFVAGECFNLNVDMSECKWMSE